MELVNRLHKERKNEKCKQLEEINIFELSNKILKYRSLWKYRVLD
jgi:hypothetical protein